MTNIDFFNGFTLSLFAKLYEAFPTPIDIDTSALALASIPEDATHDASWNYMSAADHAVHFLKQEGFLTSEGGFLSGGTELQVRLTAKGLAVLNSMPDALDSGTPLIDKAKAALSTGAKEAGKETIKQVAQWIFTAGLAAGAAAFKQ